MNEVTVLNAQELNDQVFEVRGEKVMLDRDLAVAYGVETKRLNEAVKRNIERFPDDFMFQITDKEQNELVAKCDRFRNSKHSSTNSFVFTELGATQLSGVLKSDTAVKVSIAITRAFHFLKNSVPELPHDYPSALRELANKAEQVLLLEQKNEALESDSAALRAWTDTNGYDSIGVTAKKLCNEFLIGQNELFEELRLAGWILKRNGGNEPEMSRMRQGIFVYKDIKCPVDSHKIFVTRKGLKRIRDLILKRGNYKLSNPKSSNLIERVEEIPERDLTIHEPELDLENLIQFKEKPKQRIKYRIVHEHTIESDEPISNCDMDEIIDAANGKSLNVDLLNH